MVATDLLRAVLLTVIPLAWVFGLLSFPLLLVVVVMFGTVSLVNDAASMSFVPRWCREHSCSVPMLASTAPVPWRRLLARRSPGR